MNFIPGRGLGALQFLHCRKNPFPCRYPVGLAFLNYGAGFPRCLEHGIVTVVFDERVGGSIDFDF